MYHRPNILVKNGGFQGIPTIPEAPTGEEVGGEDYSGTLKIGCRQPE